jgi:hypothetical protein
MEIPKIKLRYKDRDILFNKEFSELKIKVALNWFEIIVLILLSLIVSFKSLQFLEVESISIIIISSLSFSALVTYFFCLFRKYQLKITRFDQEHIYQKISNELIDKSKKEE